MTTFLHSIPKLLFILMPVLALLLKLFFRKKEYTYVDHAVMSLHLHTFLFISFMTGCLISFVNWDYQIIDLLLFMLIPFVYFFIAFHHFYGITWLKTAWKGLLTIISYLLIIVLSGLLNFLLLMWVG
jgi:hypothetical protein